MASMIAENWGHVDGPDGSEDFESSKINHNLIMSLLDETQIDECDDEKLEKIILSLEGEISFDGHCGFDNTVWESDLVDQSSIDEFIGQDVHLMQCDDLDHCMGVETMPTPPSDGMTSWYMDNHGQGNVSADVNEYSCLGWVHNYGPICSATPFDHEQDYSSLWHETNVTM